MKNIFKKTAGIMLASSMLCAIMATGCTASDNGDATATENTTKNATQKSTEKPTETSTKVIPEGVFTVKAGPYNDVQDLGITVESTNSNHYYLDTTTVKSTIWKTEMTDERIKDVYNVLMGYKVNEPDENGVFEYSQTELDETVKVSIPYDEGMYLLLCENGVAYDINTEYVDGCYVFDTDKLGTFMFSTEPIGRTEPTKTENVELAQQTIVDEMTGVQVSGMLPVDAKMDVLLASRGDYRLHNFYPFENRVFEEDYPKANDVSRFFYNDEEEREIDAEAGRFAGKFTEKRWNDYADDNEDATLEATITFIKDFEILEFESDLTITMPFDYRSALLNASRIGKASAMQYDYNNKEFVTLELVAEDATEKGKYQFKAKAPGQFFIGDDIALNSMVKSYTTGESEEPVA